VILEIQMASTKTVAPAQFATATIGLFVKFVSEPKDGKLGAFVRVRGVTGRGDDSQWKTIQVAADTDVQKGDFITATGEVSTLDGEIYMFAIGERGSVTEIIPADQIPDTRQAAPEPEPEAPAPAARTARAPRAAAPARR
jgi:hypothetical protein